MDLIHIDRTSHPKSTEYTFFSSAHGTFSRIDHILGHKSSLRKFKKIEIVSSIFSDHNAMRLDINYRKKICKNYKQIEAKQYTTGTTLVAQRLRICLLMQGTQVRSLVLEDLTFSEASKPVCQNYWACSLEPTIHNYWSPWAGAHALQQEKPPRETLAAQRSVAPTRHNKKKPGAATKTQCSHKLINWLIN